MIQNETHLLKVSIIFGVNPTPLRKIMAGKLVSRYFIKKMFVKLKKEKNFDSAFFKSPMVRRFLAVYGIYRKEGSLVNVARNLGLSRERVRQLLYKGNKLGLFDYKKIKEFSKPRIPKKKIIRDFQNLRRLNKLAKLYKMSTAQLSKLLQHYQIDKATLNTIRTKGEKLKCINQYTSLLKQSGRHLSSSDLQETKKGHYLSFKITKYWGSIHTFRKELNISFSPRNGQTFKVGRIKIIESK